MSGFSKKILITGGFGYLGSHTIVALQLAGYEVVSADNHSNSRADVAQRISKITGIEPRNYVVDVCDQKALEVVFKLEGSFAGIIHMAAFKAVGESVRNPVKYYRNNLQSLISVLRCCEIFDVHQLVFSSTCTVYGEPRVLPVTETAPIDSPSPYGRTKQIGEQIIQDFVNTHALQAIALRFFNPVGAHPSAEIGEFPKGVPSNLLPFMAQTAAGMHPALNIWGNDYLTHDGTCIRDYIHVCDLAKVHVLALEHLIELKQESSYEVFNIGTGKGISVLEMLEAFERVNNVQIPFQILDRRPGDIVSMYADNQKAVSILGWTAEYTLDDMVRSAWNWQKKLVDTRDDGLETVIT